jgi:hypothetical protein
MPSEFPPEVEMFAMFPVGWPGALRPGSTPSPPAVIHWARW